VTLWRLFPAHTSFGWDLVNRPNSDWADIAGPLPELLRMTEERFEAHLETVHDFTSGRVEILQPNYPIVAIGN
jgi:hypothetical protein